MTTYCFCGPTISAAEVARIAPHAVCLPPVAHGDLLRLPIRPGDVIAIVDGFYFQQYPVRHKEILHAMEQGAAVLGASSMGALRAAELDRYGMTGYGVIYRMYRSGALTGDDEVAIVHGAAADGYPATTEALVNVRATARRARRLGVLRADAERTLVAAAAEMAFHRRSYAVILDAAQERGLAAAERAAFERQLPRLRLDLKHRDAVALVHQLRHRHAVPAPSAASAAVAVPQTAFLVEWRHRYAPQTGPSDEKLVQAARILGEDFGPFYLRTAGAWFAAAGHSGAAPSSRTQDLVATFAAQRRIGDLGAWLEQRGVAQLDLAEFLHREAALERWMSDHGRPGVLDAAAEIITSHGVNGHAVDDAGTVPDRLATWLTAQEREHATATQQWARIIARSLRVERTVSIHRHLVTALRLSDAFAGLAALIAENQAFNRALAERRSDHRPQQIARSAIEAWLADMWRPEGSLAGVAAQRCFPSTAAAVRAGRELFLYCKTQGKTPLSLTLPTASPSA